MGREDQFFMATNAALDFKTGALVVFMPCTHRRNQATCVAEIPTQSGGILGGSSTANRSSRILDHRLLQYWLLLRWNCNHKGAVLLKAYLERYRLDLDAAGNHPDFDSSARFQSCRRANRLRDNDAACFVYGCHHGMYYTTSGTIVNGCYRQGRLRMLY